MAQLTDSVIQRLSHAECPSLSLEWDQGDGYYVATCRVTADDVPELIKLALRWTDPDWPDEDLLPEFDSLDPSLLPVTAWRALADLKSADAVEPLMEMLFEEEEFDEWACEELPYVFGKIGGPAVQPLLRFAEDLDGPEWVRSIAVRGLGRVAEIDGGQRDRIIERLTLMMAEADPSSIEVNSILLVKLVELKVVEAAEAIERAFANNCLDVGMLGVWECVRQELGVPGLGLEMPKHPYNSVQQVRWRMGIGVFSDQPIVGEDGLIPDAADAYFEKASKCFSASEEARQVVERGDTLGWLESLLSFGLYYLGQIIHEIGLEGVQEFVLDYAPRKVSAEPQEAGAIIFELTMFWQYLDRVYELPEAKPILDWLQSDGLVDRLEGELSDPANFGMAKSLVMTGQQAGFDMTSQQGLADFMKVYNLNLRKSAPHDTDFSNSVLNESTLESSLIEPLGRISAGPKVGRNDPCPCGSGKKFKKCCRG